MAERRFSFGENWKRYAEELDEEQIAEAIRGLKELLQVDDLRGMSFLDIGSGSGVHSLAAWRLGARPVVSFDYDRDSVECTAAVRDGAGAPEDWTVLGGSALDEHFMRELGPADIVYSWGVLHHTGKMWDAIKLAATPCQAEGSIYCIGIYNRKPVLSTLIRGVKRAYVGSGAIGKFLIKWSYWCAVTVYRLITGKGVLSEMREYQKNRGMNYWRDLEDWVGGYPFECATVDEVVSFVLPLGFDLRHLRAARSYAGVSQYVFRARRERRGGAGP